MSRKLKVEIEETERDTREFAYQMEIGEIAVWIDGSHPNRQGEILLKTYAGLVSLNNPESTWRVQGTIPDIKVRILPKGVKVTLTT